MTGLHMHMDIKQEINAAFVRLYGSNVFETSLINAASISEHVTARRLTGLAMDWRECQMTQNAAQFQRVVEAFANGLDAGIAFAVLHRSDQLSYAIFLTRRLSEKARLARAFQDEVLVDDWFAARHQSRDSQQQGRPDAGRS